MTDAKSPSPFTHTPKRRSTHKRSPNRPWNHKQNAKTNSHVVRYKHILSSYRVGSRKIMAYCCGARLYRRQWEKCSDRACMCSWHLRAAAVRAPRMSSQQRRQIVTPHIYPAHCAALLARGASKKRESGPRARESIVPVSIENTPAHPVPTVATTPGRKTSYYVLHDLFSSLLPQPPQPVCFQLSFYFPSISSLSLLCSASAFNFSRFRMYLFSAGSFSLSFDRVYIWDVRRLMGSSGPPRIFVFERLWFMLDRLKDGHVLGLGYCFCGVSLLVCVTKVMASYFPLYCKNVYRR